MTFAREAALDAFGGAEPLLPWEASLAVLSGTVARPVSLFRPDQKLGWNDARGGARSDTQRTKRERRLDAAREWLRNRGK